jgi:predicted lipoprotein with Yx(FWY)xxD motif
VAATRLTATLAGCAAAAAALATLTACAPKGAENPNEASQNIPALADVAGEASAAPTTAATTAPAAPLTLSLKGSSVPKMGQVVLDQDGFVLYRFDKDVAKPEAKSNCIDKCAQVWPPALTDGNPDLNGVEANVVGTVTRADGSRQITLDGWPVYRYIGDTKPGQWKGQNVGGTWFVVTPAGKKNLSCLTTPAPTAVQPPAASPAADSNTGGGGAGGY